MKQNKENCEYYKLSVIGSVKQYCAKRLKELDRQKEDLGLVKNVKDGVHLDYGACVLDVEKKCGSFKKEGKR